MLKYQEFYFQETSETSSLLKTMHQLCCTTVYSIEATVGGVIGVSVSFMMGFHPYNRYMSA